MNRNRRSLLIAVGVAALAIGTYAAYYFVFHHFQPPPQPGPQPLRIRLAFACDGLLIFNQEPTTLTNLTASLDPNLLDAHGHTVTVESLGPNQIVAKHYSSFIRATDGSRYWTEA